MIIDRPYTSLTFEELMIMSNLDCSEIKERADSIDWSCVSRFAPIVTYSKEFVWDYYDQWDWYAISIYQPLTEEFINEFEIFLKFYLISENEYIKRNSYLMKLIENKIKAKKHGNTY